MSIFFFFLVVLMPKVLFLCMLGFSAFFADIPGLGFLAFHRLPPNNSTAWAKVGPSYRPSSYKEPYAEHTSEQQQVVNINGPSWFPEVNKLRHLQKEAWSGHLCVPLFGLWRLPVGGLIVSPVVIEQFSGFCYVFHYEIEKFIFIFYVHFFQTWDKVMFL